VIEVGKLHAALLLFCHLRIRKQIANDVEKYEGWNFNSGNYLFTTDTK